MERKNSKTYKVVVLTSTINPALENGTLYLKNQGSVSFMLTEASVAVTQR